MRRRSFLLGLPLLAGACSQLGTFDTVIPHDSGSRRVARDVAYGADPMQQLDVYAPTARASAALPVIVFIHGGSWATGSKDGYSFLGDAFAARGFITVVISYRLVPEVRFPAFNEDAAAAVAWTQQHIGEHGGDPDRIVLVGHSAGAYIAAMLALDAHYLADAHAGAVRGVVGLAGPYDFLPFDVDSTRNAFGQAPDLQLTQPVHFARADAPPLLLLWGDADTTVGPRNIASLERVQRAAGGRVETKIYPGVSHVGILLAVSKPFRERAPVLDDVTSFARRVTA